MTIPYLVEDGQTIRCLCKGCGEVLWTKSERGVEKTAAYGDLYFAMADREGGLSEHSTPSCPGCADRLKAAQFLDEAEQWWGADVYHWFIEERVLGRDPDHAYRLTMKLAGDRHPVRVTRYVRADQ